MAKEGESFSALRRSAIRRGAQEVARDIPRKMSQTKPAG